MTGRANLYVDQGILFSTDLDVNGSDGGVIDITGYTFFGSSRKIYSTKTVVFDFTINVVDAINGKLLLKVLPDQSRYAIPGKYQYDVIMIDIDGKSSKLLEGLVFIIETMTDTQ